MVPQRALNGQSQPRTDEVSVYRKEKTEALIHFTVEEQACDRVSMFLHILR